MRDRPRMWLFVASALFAAGAMLYGMRGLPAFGTFTGPNTAYFLDMATSQRHVYNVPTAVNFDYRGFDTLGEEFIFFTSIAGLLFLFSEVKESGVPIAEEPSEHERQLRKTGAMLWLPTGLAAFVAAMGINVAAHGQLTPGGGFQGGAIFGSAFACIYLGVGMSAFMRCAPKTIFDWLESSGALAFTLLGIGAMIASGAFLANVLPLGKTGATVSGGTIYFLSCAVFVEIGAGFVLMLSVFMKQMREERR